MTQHGKVIITLGIGIFTVSSLLWIILQNWQWIAAGAAIFVGSAFASLILSIETKNISPTTTPTQNTVVQDNWQPPNTPPPDEKERTRTIAETETENVSVDPFYGRQDP